MQLACQAFRDHKLFDPLTEPGTADLTADVDFKYLMQCVADKGNNAADMDMLCFLYRGYFDGESVGTSFPVKSCWNA